MFKCSDVYLANFNATEDTVVNQGGTSSGKTVAILQVLFSIAISEKSVITIVGQDIPNLKVGALRDALEIYENSPELKSLVVSYNKTDRIFEFSSGTIMEFKSYGSPQDAKSGKRDYCFVNEANGIPFDIYTELALRTRKRVFLDYNPNNEFWVHQKLINRPNTKLIISDHRHNPFLSQKVRDKIEGLKDIDLDLWKVYARGMTGKIEGLIFRNWTYCDTIPLNAELIARGMDFGFTADPTSVVAVYRMDGELWIKEELYQTNLTNPQIHNELVKEGLFIADSAEPKSITELRSYGLHIEGAKKGADSIKNSIDILKRFKMNVTRSSVNLAKELNSYKWKVDKATGNSINEPVDFLNHAIDALRYVALNKLQHKGEASVHFG
jgi:phage terminase large subunit